jgi:hypothetical protein
MRLAEKLKVILTSAILAAVTTWFIPTTTEASILMSGNVMIVNDDRGGSIMKRDNEVKDLQDRGVLVRIQGRVCLSSCTMYLGVKNVCVSPKTIFGFHGPSRNSKVINQASFDYFSKVMAKDYPPAISKWFMEKARYKIATDYYRISGQELIRHGIAPCL